MMKKGGPLLLGEGPRTKGGTNNYPCTIGRDKRGKETSEWGKWEESKNK